MRRVLAACVLAACGSGSSSLPPGPADSGATGTDAQVDAGDAGLSDARAEVFPAFPPDLPTVVKGAGPTMTDPIVVPIFFADEDPAKVTAMTDFLGKLAGSAYWDATTKEYGVASLTVAPKVSLAANAPATIANADIPAWLSARIAANELPANVVGRSIYTIYYPQPTIVHLGQQTSCADFGGFHQDGNGIVFAVIAGCATYGAHLAVGETISGIDFTTGLTTHELVEAVTDPYVSSQPAYASVDPKHQAWARYLNGGEIGDTCETEPNAFFRNAALGYVVQRTYSNAAAILGHDPCVPAAPVPYVAAFPVTGSGSLAVGATTTIPVHLVSDGPTGPFDVAAIDFASEHGKPSQLALALDKASGKNGDTLMLTITVLVADSSGFEGYLLETTINGVRRRTAGLVHQ